MQDYIYPNADDWQGKFWKNNYLISVTSQGILFAVNADCEQDALDYIIDYAKDKMPGLVARFDELDDDEREDYISGGNEGLYLTTYNVSIKII